MKSHKSVANCQIIEPTEPLQKLGDSLGAENAAPAGRRATHGGPFIHERCHNNLPPPVNLTKPEAVRHPHIVKEHFVE
jgi:hypothetical protein